MLTNIVGQAIVGEAIVGQEGDGDNYMSNYDVTVDISVAETAGTQGFGTPLVAEIGNTDDKEYTEYSSLKEVLEDGYKTDSAAYKMCAAIFAQEHKPAKVAVMHLKTPELTELTEKISAVTDKDWRQLVLTGSVNSDYYNDELATLLLAEGKTMFATVASIEYMESIPKYKNVFCVIHTDPYAVGAVVGEAAGQEAGSFNYKNMVLAGVDPMSWTSGEMDIIASLNACTIVSKAGDTVTTSGKSMYGQYMDITDIVDWVVQNMRYKVQKLLNRSAKIAYDNTGISLIETEMADVMNTGYNNGIIATNDDGSKAYTITCAPRSETSAENRSTRHYPYATFEFDAAGAIDTVHITGTLKI
jgi:hypothetical protein